MHNLIMKTAAACLFVGTGLATPANAVNVQVTGEIVADNFVMVNRQYGSATAVNVFDGSASNNPFVTRTFNFNVETDELAACTIQVVVWNEASGLSGGTAVANTPAAWAGYFEGNKATIFSGLNNIKAFDTQIPSTAGVPSLQRMTDWIADTVNPSTVINGAVQPLWGAPNLNENGTIAQWIWSNQLIPTPGNTNGFVEDLHHRSFTFPCADFVKVPDPVVPPTDAFKMDHFQCYPVEQIEGEADKVEIFVEDQFGQGEIVTGKPVLLCNPSAKLHRDQFFEISNPIDHLVCYEIIEQTPVEKLPIVETTNQFARQIIQVGEQRSLFCLPSGKRHVD